MLHNSEKNIKRYKRPRLQTLRLLGLILLFQLTGTSHAAEPFHLDSKYNKGSVRFEIDNDTVFKEDSNFSNGWSLQYQTVRYDSWDNIKAPGYVKWVGKHFPSLDDGDSIVRVGQGLGQTMFTPGDLTAESPAAGDLPYAGTLTYTLNWQSFNRNSARIFQTSLGVLGEESMAEEFQKFVHNDLSLGEDPQGWDTQRDTEPILNIAYQYMRRLAHQGSYTNDWGGQLTLAPGISVGNLDTSVDLGISYRFGWNILEGFGTYPAPPGSGIFQAADLPKPATASPHSIEVVLVLRGVAVLYSVLYDGSLLTDDDRDVEREYFVASGLVGLSYHYHKLLTLRAHFQVSTDLLNAESIPDSPSGDDKTQADFSLGSIVLDFHF